MEKINLNVGSKVFIKDQEYEIKKQIDLKTVLALNFSTNKLENISINDIQNKKESSELIINENIPEEHWVEAKNRLEIITPLLNKQTTKNEIENIAIKNNLHFSTIYRWIVQYKENTLLSSLLPKHLSKGGKGTLRTDEETELIIQKSINDLYLSQQKFSPRKVYFDIVRRCKNARITPPSENTVRNRISQIEEKKKIKYRESAILADRKYRNTDGIFPEGKYPLDFIQIDHTPMDIDIVDEVYRRSIGRPYLTLAIDVYSRMITGFYISLDVPSYFSVSQCISQSILTKEKYLREIGVEGKWYIYGIPRALGMDNAQEFRSKDLQRVCEEYGITISWRPVARPQFGGHIERMMGTAMSEIHTLPGTKFSNISKKGEYNSEKNSIFTLKELEKWFANYIINQYHKQIHSGIRMTPEKKYELGIFGDDENPGRGLAEKISNENYFKISLLPTVERTIQQFGVKIDNIVYYSDILRRWIKSKDKNNNAKKFMFKRDPRDISVIWFYDPTIKDYFEVHYRNISYPPISIWDLKNIRKYLDDKNQQDYDETIIFKTYYKLQEIQKEAAQKTKTVRREQAAKKIRKDKKEFDNIKIKSKKQILTENHIRNDSSTFDDLFKDIKPFDEIEI
ncbi:DDE-type integrase/transposase/recombinase [Aliarcobacter butzleri]|uniref:Mu transposase C-terminal domain-containing protein n=1 Tax=Aliarcobacter butzleri TaxID=28197 RepID=UPI00263CADC9|nr:Mu transposase C-terminal domain-containing protein [Aliarcobacter butzleri]MDN5042277.1 DDE-type integrase/transposase/recombinase [Aliarcobacter butzleri]